MNQPEYWRINLAVEKVIAKHEWEILENQLAAQFKENPFMALVLIGKMAAFAANVSSRLKNIKPSAEEKKPASPSRVLEVRGLDDNYVITASDLTKVLEGIDSVTFS